MKGKGAILLVVSGIIFLCPSVTFPQGGMIKGPVPPLAINPAPPQSVPLPQPAVPTTPSGQSPATKGQEKGVIDPRTGQFFPGVMGGVMNPRTGDILPKVEGGYLNPRTGEVIPVPP